MADDIEIQRPEDPLRRRKAPKKQEEPIRNDTVDDVDFLAPPPPPAPRLPKRGGIDELREWIKNNPTEKKEEYYYNENGKIRNLEDIIKKYGFPSR